MKTIPVFAALSLGLFARPVVIWAQGDEVTALFLYKAAWHQQSDDGDPVPLPPSQGPFDIFAQAYLSDTLLNDPDALMFITGMTLRTPSGRVEAMEFDPESGSFVFGAEAPSPQALNLRYGPGTYRFTLSSLITGNSVFTLDLGPDEYPPAPKVTNFAAAQRIDPAAEFGLEWTEFTGGGDREIWVEIFPPEGGDSVLELGPLPGSDRRALIPAGSLTVDQEYRARLTFTRYTRADDTVTPSVYTAFESYNLLPIRTEAGGPPAPSSFTGWLLLPNGDLQLRIACTPGRALTVEGASALGAPWQQLAAVTPSASPTEVVVAASALGDQRFLRASQR